MHVPSGKRIRLYVDEIPYLSLQKLKKDNAHQYKEDYVEIPLYLGEDINLKTSSEFGSPFSSMQEGAANLGLMLQFIGAGANRLGANQVGEALENISTQSEFSAYQFWKFSNPVSFSINIQLFMGIAGLYDGRREVYYPAMRLSELTLPTVKVIGKIRGKEISSLTAPGPTASTFLKEAGGQLPGQTYSICVGNMIKLDSCVIKSVEATYSKEVDTNGFPISAKIMMEISSTTVGTTDMLRNMVNYDSERLVEQAKEDAKLIMEENINSKVGNWIGTFLG